MEAEEPEMKKSKTKNGAPTSSAVYFGYFTLLNDFKQLPTQRDTHQTIECICNHNEIESYLNYLNK